MHAGELDPSAQGITMQFLFAFGLTGLTVIIHALGTLGAVAHLSRVWQRNKAKQRALASEIQIVRVVSILLLLHLLEAGVWALSFRAARVLPDLETAVYFSLTSHPRAQGHDILLHQ